MGAIITQKQNNKPWTLTWKASGRYPMVADRIYATLADAQAYVDDLTATASATPGLVLSVVNDGKNNGIYYVQSIAQAATETTEFVPGVLVAAGAGAGSEAVETFTVGEDGKIVEAENIGQILYVTTGTEDYPAGPYIVTGVGAVAKLGTTTATGDIAGDVENLKGRMSTAEGEIDALQAAVGDASKGLVADVADIKSTIGDTASGLVKDIADNAANIENLWSTVQGGIHFKGVYKTLPTVTEITDEETEDTVTGWKDPITDEVHVFDIGDIIIVEPAGDYPNTITEPTKEYILTYTDACSCYTWVELGDVTAEGQRISAIEKLIDSDKVATWNTGATQAATLTANISNYALKTEVADSYVAKETGKSLVSDTLIAKLDGLANIKSVDANSVLSVNAEGALTANLNGYVAKDGDKVLSTNDFTNEFKTKLENVASGAQVNVIETIKVNGSDLTVEGKAVNIDLVNHLAGKVSINGQVLAETEDNGVLAAVVDASDIHLGAAIGDHTAESTTVQGMLGTVYDIANSKIGSIHLAAGNTSNVLALSKTNIANDTIELKIAEGSAITATAGGLDLVWTEL